MIDLSDGIDLFNNGRYFECHDFFENLWVIAAKPDRLFFQGMVQMAVGCYHFEHGNHKGALSQFTRATKKLSTYSPVYRGVNILKLLKDIQPFLEILTNFQEQLNKPEYPKIEYTLLK